MFLSDSLRRELERVAEHPSLEEIGQRLPSRRFVRVRPPPAKVLREQRDRR